MEKKYKKAKWLSGEASQIAVKRREGKSQGEKERYTHLNAELHGKQMGKQWKQCQTLFWGAPKSLQMVIAAMKLKDAYSLEAKL